MLQDASVFHFCYQIDESDSFKSLLPGSQKVRNYKVRSREVLLSWDEESRFVPLVNVGEANLKVTFCEKKQ